MSFYVEGDAVLAEEIGDFVSFLRVILSGDGNGDGGSPFLFLYEEFEGMRRLFEPLRDDFESFTRVLNHGVESSFFCEGRDDEGIFDGEHRDGIERFCVKRQGIDIGGFRVESQEGWHGPRGSIILESFPCARGESEHSESWFSAEGFLPRPRDGVELLPRQVGTESGTCGVDEDESVSFGPDKVSIGNDGAGGCVMPRDDAIVIGVCILEVW